MLIVSIAPSCDLIMNNFQHFQVRTRSNHFHLNIFFLLFVNDDSVGFKVLVKFKNLTAS